MTATAIKTEAFPKLASLPVCLSENLYRLVSLWDIVKTFKVDELFRAVRELRNTAEMLNSEINQGYRKPLLSSLESKVRECQRICNDLDLPMSGIRISKALGAFVALGSLSPKGCQEAAEKLQMDVAITIEDELSLRLFFQVSPEKAAFYQRAEPFGIEVADSFPSASFDIEEANKCYALARNTACVMHSMRVIEAGLALFAPTLNVNTSHKDWGRIISETEKSVQSIESSPSKPPNWKDDREFNFQCIADFRIFKNAWRNASMHGRGKYGDEEAMDIMNRVRSFTGTSGTARR